VKRRDLLQHLQAHGCYVVRDRGPHTVYADSSGARKASVPRHTEIKWPTVRAICKGLGIPIPMP
jgi:predicted RNA binding protein YcfA (HicA-like mRNA interferase family)